MLQSLWSNMGARRLVMVLLTLGLMVIGMVARQQNQSPINSKVNAQSSAAVPALEAAETTSIMNKDHDGGSIGKRRSSGYARVLFMGSGGASNPSSSQ